MNQRQRLSRVWPLAGLALALAGGAALRLSFPYDIEWKSDERWTLFHAQAMIAGGVWPPVGMGSSIGAPNPGLSLWVFAGIIELFGAHNGPELARAVQTLNILALLAFTGFAFVAVPRARREPWLWAVCLWALNPVAILFERKIWPPSVLPLGMVALLWAWRYRRHFAAAVAWGVLGALMAQVHVAVAFLALALAAWTLAHDRAAFPWRGWLAGSVVGAAPALPWLLEMGHHGTNALLIWRWPRLSFFGRWLTQPFGFGVDYSLRKDFPDFLAGPRLDGHPTYLMAATEAALAALTAIVLVRAALVLIRRQGRPSLKAVFLGDSPATVLICAALWGYGGLLTLLSIIASGPYRHYMIVIAPLMALWAAMTALLGDRGAPSPRLARTLLPLLCVCQAAMSLGFLTYVDRKGVIDGDYGATWKAQQIAPTPTALDKSAPIN